MAQYECIVCGWVYDEEKGDPDSGVAAGTKWDDLPDGMFIPYLFIFYMKCDYLR